MYVCMLYVCKTAINRVEFGVVAEGKVNTAAKQESLGEFYLPTAGTVSTKERRCSHGRNGGATSTASGKG